MTQSVEPQKALPQVLWGEKAPIAPLKACALPTPPPCFPPRPDPHNSIGLGRPGRDGVAGGGEREA